MKKVFLSVLGLALVAGCSGYDYYESDVRYRQKGEDCVYYFSEDGERFSSEIRNLQDAKKIVYRNTQCSDLYGKDTFGNTERNDRKAIVPVFVENDMQKKTSCGCSKCAKKHVLQSRYVIVPSYMD